MGRPSARELLHHARQPLRAAFVTMQVQHVHATHAGSDVDAVDGSDGTGHSDNVSVAGRNNGDAARAVARGSCGNAGQSRCDVTLERNSIEGDATGQRLLY